MKHLRDNNETYFSHFKFASGVGLTLVFRGVIFLLHAVLPICMIPKRWNLEGTTAQFEAWNTYVNGRANGSMNLQKERK